MMASGPATLLAMAGLALVTWAAYMLVELAFLRGGPRLVAAAASLTVALSVIVNGIASVFQQLNGYERKYNALQRAIYSASPLVMALVLAVFAAGLAMLAARLRELRRGAPTPDSLKEALDALPDGVLFSTQDGRPILRNVQMERLDYEGAGASGVLMSDDGRIWQLRRGVLQVGGDEVCELIATDTTEEYGLVHELERENARLLEVNEHLRAYSADMVRLTREEEVLAAKIRIHDELSQALVALRAYELQDPAERDREALLATWRRAITLLKTASYPDDAPTDVWELLVKAARAVDVDLVLEGDLPQDGKLYRVVIALVHECLNNAVRHGSAHEVTVHITREDDVLEVRVTNDGEPPAAPIEATGGLANMRAAIEQAGGTMCIDWSPRLVVVARFDCREA